MIITHESNYGREYHVRVVLTTNDIEGIAEKMCTSCNSVDGKILALFIRGALVEVLTGGQHASRQGL
jgi:hypothetical protein